MSASVIARMSVATATAVACAVVGSGVAAAAPAQHGQLPSSAVQHAGPSAAGTEGRSPAGLPPLTGTQGPSIGATLLAVCSLSFRTLVSVERVVQGALGPVPVPALPDGCPVRG